MKYGISDKVKKNLKGEWTLLGVTQSVWRCWWGYHFLRIILKYIIELCMSGNEYMVMLNVVKKCIIVEGHTTFLVHFTMLWPMCWVMLGKYHCSWSWITISSSKGIHEVDAIWLCWVRRYVALARVWIG